jgi:hypothetical protein
MAENFKGKIFVTLDNLGYQSSLYVCIEYFTQMVRHLPDRSGSLDSLASAELIGVYAVSWTVGDEIRRPSFAKDCYGPGDYRSIWDHIEAIARNIVTERWASEFQDLCLENASAESDV